MTKKSEWLLKNCKLCEKEFLSPPYRKGYFCSTTCQRKGRKFKQTELVHGKCEFCGKDFSQPKWWKSPAKFCSITCMSKVRGQNMRAEKHFRWKGGLKRPGKEKRAIKEAKQLYKKCQRCGSEKNLHGHHKIKYSERPDLCDVMENIEILCCQCHAKEHPELNFIAQPIVKNGTHKNCVVCSTEFYVPRYLENVSKYCSNKCRQKIQFTGFVKTCIRCSTTYKSIPSKSEKSKFCTNRCKMLARYGK